jgi:hypothetical protein
MSVEGDSVTKEQQQFVRDLSSPQLTVEYRTVPNINITNEFSPRFGLNWIKLNSWNMTEFDTIINLDTGGDSMASRFNLCGSLTLQVLVIDGGSSAAQHHNDFDVITKLDIRWALSAAAINPVPGFVQFLHLICRVCMPWVQGSSC